MARHNEPFCDRTTDVASRSRHEYLHCLFSCAHRPALCALLASRSAPVFVSSIRLFNCLWPLSDKSGFGRLTTVIVIFPLLRFNPESDKPIIFHRRSAEEI